MDVKMKQGFQYTTYLPGYAVPSMKKFTESLEWTDSVTLRDSTKEEYEEAMKYEDTEISKSSQEPSEKKSKKSKTQIGFSSLDNFFQEEKPKRKKK